MGGERAEEEGKKGGREKRKREKRKGERKDSIPGFHPQNSRK
jgi:hypothetical protein